MWSPKRKAAAPPSGPRKKATISKKPKEKGAGGGTANEEGATKLSITPLDLAYKQEKPLVIKSPLRPDGAQKTAVAAKGPRARSPAKPTAKAEMAQPGRRIAAPVKMEVVTAATPASHGWWDPPVLSLTAPPRMQLHGSLIALTGLATGEAPSPGGEMQATSRSCHLPLMHCTL